MQYDPSKQHRRSIRLKGYDYRNAGPYFVTICTKNRVCILDDPIVNAIVNDVWQALPSWFPTIDLDEFVAMPNHIHFIVWIAGTTVGTRLAGVLKPQKDGGKLHPYEIPTPQKINTSPTLGDIVGAFKSLVFTVYLDWTEKNDPARCAKFWQGNYYEHIIRNDKELNAIRQYIIDNPEHWKIDRDNLENMRKLHPPKNVEEYLEDIEKFISKREPHYTSNSPQR